MSIDFWLGVGEIAGIYGIFVLGLQINVGFTGLLNLGQAGFMSIGAYAMGMLVVDAGWTVDFRSEAVERARPDFLAIDFDLLNDAWTAAMREEIPVYCWTVRTAEQRAQAEVQADALIWEGDGRPGI